MQKPNAILLLKKLWHVIWYEDTLLSWLLNALIAFVLIKFIVYPGLGLLLSTSHPVVAVVSSSMEHASGFDNWWDSQQVWYTEKNITKEMFLIYPLKNGFNKGDIMILKGKQAKEINIGDVLVFKSHRPDPIIHRVVKKWQENDKYFFQTKGDNNRESIPFGETNELRIQEDKIIGVAIARIPLLGWIKIAFVSVIESIGW